MNRKDIDTIAACIGSALKAAHANCSPDSIDARANGVWDVKNRIANELRLANPRFDGDRFTARIQYWYETASGL